jgi:hypothetical protein
MDGKKIPKKQAKTSIDGLWDEECFETCLLESDGYKLRNDCFKEKRS